MDLKRDAVLALAEKALDDCQRRGIQAVVYFKFTCPSCGERIAFDEPNILYEQGECCGCGFTHPINEAGFTLVMGLHPQQVK